VEAEWNGRRSHGRAEIESTELRFRGEFRLTVPFADVFAVSADGTVSTFAVSGNTLFVGGAFNALRARQLDMSVLIATGVLTAYLNSRHAGAAVLTVAEPLVDATLAAAGIVVTADPAQAGVVVVSFDRTFSYAKLLLAYRAVRHFGAAIVATNPDPFCPSPDGGLPDCAAMLAAIEACTEARAEAVLGKPGEHMAAELLSRLAVPPSETAIVGDRISTDIAMSQSLGMTSVLVLSGSTDAGELAVSPVRPDYVIEGIGQLLPAGQADGPTDRSSA